MFIIKARKIQIKRKCTCRQSFELPWWRKQDTILNAPLDSRLAGTVFNIAQLSIFIGLVLLNIWFLSKRYIFLISIKQTYKCLGLLTGFKFSYVDLIYYLFFFFGCSLGFFSKYLVPLQKVDFLISIKKYLNVWVSWPVLKFSYVFFNFLFFFWLVNYLTF